MYQLCTFVADTTLNCEAKCRLYRHSSCKATNLQTSEHYCVRYCTQMAVVPAASAASAEANANVTVRPSVALNQLGR